MIILEGLSKSYAFGDGRIAVLKELNVSIARGAFVGIVGPSGSGKSTLLNCLGLLDREFEGSYRLGGVEVRALSDREASALRNRRMGFIFQSFHLFPMLSALENVMVPMEYAGTARSARKRRAEHLLERVGLGHRLGHTPLQLSGGEQQRVAIARALTNDPEVILADEPTGNLDQAVSREVMAILHELKAGGKALVMVTHNPELLEGLDAVYVMDEGRLFQRSSPLGTYRRQRSRSGISSET